MATAPDIRGNLLGVIRDLSPRDPRDGSLQLVPVLNEAVRRIGAAHDLAREQALLTQIHDLFRTGMLAWGYNISNPNPPFFHVTETGRSLLANLSRDPGNPDGYLQHLFATARVNEVAGSYIKEGIACYVSGTHKAAAVMVGAAAESLVLELRDTVVNALERHGKDVPAQLRTWQVRVVLDRLQDVLAAHARLFSKQLREEFEGYWPAFTQQIRAVRNDAGHPSSVDPISPEAVQAAFLIFPELARLQTELVGWVQGELR